MLSDDLQLKPLSPTHLSVQMEVLARSFPLDEFEGKVLAVAEEIYRSQSIQLLG